MDTVMMEIDNGVCYTEREREREWVWDTSSSEEMQRRIFWRASNAQKPLEMFSFRKRNVI